jgi:hypothetical protein
MKKANLLIFVLLVIISILALSMYLQQKPVPEPVPQQATQPPPETPPKNPIVHYPVPVPQQVEPAAEPALPIEEPQPQEVVAPVLPKQLPPVEKSDQSIEQALANLTLKKSIFELILLEGFIQRFVSTIDNLPETKLPRAHLPVVPPKGRFIVSGTEQAPQTSKRNHSRYAAHVQLLESLDQDLTLKIYVHFYPLFQKAFQQLGYKNAYFNDRLVFVIDHLLETPEVAEPIPLAQPAILYIYTDPLLEKLSAGQKTLLRLGPEHRKKVKSILQAYRDRLISLQP